MRRVLDIVMKERVKAEQHGPDFIGGYSASTIARDIPGERGVLALLRVAVNLAAGRTTAAELRAVVSSRLIDAMEREDLLPELDAAEPDA